MSHHIAADGHKVGPFIEIGVQPSPDAFAGHPGPVQRLVQIFPGIHNPVASKVEGHHPVGIFLPENLPDLLDPVPDPESIRQDGEPVVRNAKDKIIGKDLLQHRGTAGNQLISCLYAVLDVVQLEPLHIKENQIQGRHGHPFLIHLQKLAGIGQKAPGAGHGILLHPGF